MSCASIKLNLKTAITMRKSSDQCPVGSYLLLKPRYTPLNTEAMTWRVKLSEEIMFQLISLVILVILELECVFE